MSTNKYSKEDCIESLHKAAEVLGEAPTSRQYQKLDIEPKSPYTFQRKFGSWNEAKIAAGFEANKIGAPYSKKPKLLQISTDEWQSLSVNRRTTLSRYVRLWRIKIEEGCTNCGYDEKPQALEFHHANSESKIFNVSDYPPGKVNWEEAKNEIKKCQVLCSNCHRIEESNVSVK